MRFTIITPTLLRPSLVQTCASIDTQPFKDWQHLVVVDVPLIEITTEHSSLLDGLKHKQREFLFCDQAHADFGNTCRSNAWDHANGEYLIYLDDDDVYSPNALATLDQALRDLSEPPVWGTFPLLFRGEIRHKQPPQTGNTMNQFFHRKTHDGYQLRWPAEKIYSGDGLMVDMLGALFPHVALDIEPIVIVDGARGGWPRFKRVHLTPSGPMEKTPIS